MGRSVFYERKMLHARRVDDIRTVLSEGDKIEALVVNHNRKSGELMISMKAKELADTAEVMEKWLKR